MRGAPIAGFGRDQHFHAERSMSADVSRLRPAPAHCAVSSTARQLRVQALPPDGEHDPKVLLRVDWGCCQPAPPSPAGGGATCDGVEMLRRDVYAAALARVRALVPARQPCSIRPCCEADRRIDSRSLCPLCGSVQRASSLGPPQKRLKRSMQEHERAVGFQMAPSFAEGSCLCARLG